MMLIISLHKEHASEHKYWIGLHDVQGKRFKKESLVFTPLDFAQSNERNTYLWLDETDKVNH